MGRIEKAFAAVKRPAFIGFVVAGDPDKGHLYKDRPGADRRGN